MDDIQKSRPPLHGTDTNPQGRAAAALSPRTRCRVVLTIETDIPGDIPAEATVALATILDIGNDTQRILGQVLSILISDPCN